MRTQQAITEQLSYGDFLQRLIEDEVERRGQKQLHLRLRRATLDQTKTLESFDFGFNPTLNRQQIFDLATCRFMEQHASLLIQGPAGVGKSHIAQALAHEACRRRFDVLFIPAARMLRICRAAAAPTGRTNGGSSSTRAPTCSSSTTSG